MGFFDTKAWYNAFMTKLMKADFFNRTTLLVAEQLLGAYLVRKRGGTIKRYRIIEVEAYDGFDDKASHAHKGETVRNKPMFGPAGVWYVYLVYGMHWMLNVVTGGQGYPAAVLIRAVQTQDGEVINGPARLTKRLGVAKTLNSKSAGRSCGLWIEDSGFKVSKNQIKTAPRIGVDYAGSCAKKPYRFILNI